MMNSIYSSEPELMEPEIFDPLDPSRDDPDLSMLSATEGYDYSMEELFPVCEPEVQAEGPLGALRARSGPQLKEAMQLVIECYTQTRLQEILKALVDSNDAVADTLFPELLLLTPSSEGPDSPSKTSLDVFSPRWECCENCRTEYDAGLPRVAGECSGPRSPGLEECGRDAYFLDAMDLARNASLTYHEPDRVKFEHKPSRRRALHDEIYGMEL